MLWTKKQQSEKDFGILIYKCVWSMGLFEVLSMYWGINYVMISWQGIISEHQISCTINNEYQAVIDLIDEGALKALLQSRMIKMKINECEYTSLWPQNYFDAKLLKSNLPCNK